MKVLIAEDDAIIRRLLEVTLAKWGYETVLATDGAEAWRVLQQPDAPSLVLLDWMMPVMDGPEVCRRLRAAGPRFAYVILLTAKGRKEDLLAGLEAGADDYVTKPFDREELKARVEVGARMIALQGRLSDHERELAVARALTVERARFDAAVEGMSDGIVVTDRQWNISFANRAACLLLNAPPEGAAGARLETLLSQFTLSTPIETLRTRAEKVTALEITRPDTSPPLFIDGRLTRLIEENGGFAGVVLTLRDVTEQRRTSQWRASFFDMLSHKLRTPLTVMSTYLQLFMRVPPERRGARLERLLEVFGTELGQLERQVVTLLEFKALDREALRGSLLRASIGAGIRDAADRVRTHYARRGLEVRPEVDAAVDALEVDPSHLELILEKLMDNAVKFGDKEPVAIRIRAVAADRGLVRLEVSDNGPGIPHEYFDRLLNGFVQIEERSTGQIEGMGLGLMLTRRITEAYGGSIQLQSRMGGGTTVIITLPGVSTREEAL